jgi:chromosome segregation ATPase
LEITDFFDTLKLSDKMHLHFKTLLDDANSKYENAKMRFDENNTSIVAEGLTLENLKSEMAKLSVELGSVRDSWTEFLKKLEALRRFISSSEKMREVFGDTFVSPIMNPSLPTISDLEKEISSLEVRMKNLQDRDFNLNVEIMQAQMSVRTSETELMNARTEKEKASRECEKIQRNIQRAKLGLSLRE